MARRRQIGAVMGSGWRLKKRWAGPTRRTEAQLRHYGSTEKNFGSTISWDNGSTDFQRWKHRGSTVEAPAAHCGSIGFSGRKFWGRWTFI